MAAQPRRCNSTQSAAHAEGTTTMRKADGRIRDLSTRNATGAPGGNSGLVMAGYGNNERCVHGTDNNEWAGASDAGARLSITVESGYNAQTGGDRISTSAEGKTSTLPRMPHTEKQKPNTTDAQEEFREGNDGRKFAYAQLDDRMGKPHPHAIPTSG